MSDNGKKDWWAAIRNGLVTDPHAKHIKAMGPALSLYLYLHIYADRDQGRLFRKYQTISDHMGIPVTTLKKWMNRLKDCKYVELTSLGYGLSIQITKFRSIRSIQTGTSKSGRSTKNDREKYQIGSEEVPDSTRDTKVGTSSSNSKQKVNDLCSTKNGTSKESINESNKKDCPTFSSPADKSAAQKMYQMLLAINPKHKKPNFLRWENDIRLIQTQDGRTLEEILDLFTYANNHDFWRSNILSPTKLRKQWDQLTIQKNSNGSGNGFRSQADINSASSGRVVT